MLTEDVYVWSVLIAGLLSFFSPCTFPLFPVYLAYLGGTDLELSRSTVKLGRLRIHSRLLGNTLMFIAGLSTVFVLLGFGAGALGGVINNSWFIMICGLIVVMFGIYHTGAVQLLFMEREKKLNIQLQQRQSLAGAFLLGLVFSFGWTPCIGPVLAAVLSISASEGSAVFGGWLMFVYTIGFAIPFLLVGLFSDLLLQRLKKMYTHLRLLKVISGILLIVMGLLLMMNNLYMITHIFR